MNERFQRAWRYASDRFKILAWACLRPWEIASVAFICLQAHRLAGKRGGRVRVLARAGGLGDVLWAAAAAKIAAQSSPKDVLLFLTPPSMREPLELAAPELKSIHSHLPNPYMQSLLRRPFDVVDLAYESEDVEGTHMVQSYLRQLGCEQESREFRWHFEDSSAPEVRQPIAFVYAGPSWRVRELPLETWQVVVRHLQQDWGFRVLQVLPDNAEKRQIPGCDGFLTALPLAKLCSLFNQSALVVAIDSIMLHLAAGTKAPLVGVFGPTLVSCRLFETPRHQAVAAEVTCAGCHHRQPRLHWETGCDNNIACMRGISSDQIMKAVASVLAATRTHS